MVHKRSESRESTARGFAGMPSLRIIGGQMSGRKLLYSGADRTRPMKDRVREAVFNLLGPSVEGRQALDIFAGTGALGLEALSRGAAKATFVEQHFPTASLIRQNAALLEVADRCQVHAGNAFVWAAQHTLDPVPSWVVFCAPPYAFYLDRRAEMLGLIGSLVDKAPADSSIVVESDRRFDTAQLPSAENWLVREYSPAVVSIFHK